MIRIACMLTVATLSAVSLHNATTSPIDSLDPASIPRFESLDKQDGNQVTIRGIISVQKKNTIKEHYFVDTYKIRGLSNDKLRPWIGKRVIIIGEFRVLSGEVIIYARDISKAPEPGEDQE